MENSNPPVKILHFSDVLCVWAYVSAIRIEELQQAFGDQIRLDYYYLPTFGNVQTKIDNGWSSRGGLLGYANHVAEVVKKFPHVPLNKDCWQKVVPATSLQAHLYLKAIQLNDQKEGTANHDALAWAIRCGFFQEARDISQLSVLDQIARENQIDTHAVRELLDNGQAIASLSTDMQLRNELKVDGSPTLVFNEGRQKIYGNVGYLMIEANIKEMLSNRVDSASWC